MSDTDAWLRERAPELFECAICGDDNGGDAAYCARCEAINQRNMAKCRAANEAERQYHRDFMAWLERADQPAIVGALRFLFRGLDLPPRRPRELTEADLEPFPRRRSPRPLPHSRPYGTGPAGLSGGAVGRRGVEEDHGE